jgi:hypothetical protein
MKFSRKAIFAMVLTTVLLGAVPTTAIASESSACEAARNLNTFEAWFYRTFLC